MKLAVKVESNGLVSLPTEVMDELNVNPGDVVVWDTTEILTNDLEKDGYVAATLSKLEDYLHEESHRVK